MRVLLASALAIAASLASQPSEAPSAAANYLAQEHVARACEGPGSINSDGLQEADLTGDGAKDLILDHNGIECSGGIGRSSECGAANCSIYFYVRTGKLLKLSMEVLAVGATVLAGKPPRIELGGTASRGNHFIRWNGRKFADVR